jgi:hypothetical protein
MSINYDFLNPNGFPEHKKRAQVPQIIHQFPHLFHRSLIEIHWDMKDR